MDALGATFGFRSALLVLTLGTGLKEQPLFGVCCSGDRVQKFKRMNKKHGIPLKSFTWSCEAAHISLFHASQITEPRVDGAWKVWYGKCIYIYIHIDILSLSLVVGTELPKLLDFPGGFVC